MNGPKLVKRKVENEKTEQVVFNSCEPIFKLAKLNGKFVIIMGNNRASEKEFETQEEANKYISSKPYELILNMYLIHKVYEEKFKEMEKSRKESKADTPKN